MWEKQIQMIAFFHVNSKARNIGEKNCNNASTVGVISYNTEHQSIYILYWLTLVSTQPPAENPTAYRN